MSVELIVYYQSVQECNFPEVRGSRQLPMSEETFKAIMLAFELPSTCPIVFLMQDGYYASPEVKDRNGNHSKWHYYNEMSFRNAEVVVRMGVRSELGQNVPHVLVFRTLV